MSKPRREPHIRHDLGRVRNAGVRRSLGKPKKSTNPVATGTLPGGLRLTKQGEQPAEGDSQFAIDLNARAQAAARQRRGEHPVSSEQVGSVLTVGDRLVLSELIQTFREHTDTLREVHGLAPIERESVEPEALEDSEAPEEAVEAPEEAPEEAEESADDDNGEAEEDASAVESAAS